MQYFITDQVKGAIIFMMMILTNDILDLFIDFQ